MIDPYQDMPEGARHLVDALSISVLLGSLVDWLPAVASLLTIIWTAIRILETKTVSGWLGRSRDDA